MSGHAVAGARTCQNRQLSVKTIRLSLQCVARPGEKPKKKPDKCLALSFEGAFKANLQRGTLSPRKWEEETQR